MTDYLVFNVGPSKGKPAAPLVSGYLVPDATDENDAVDRVLKTCGCTPTRYAVTKAVLIDRRVKPF